MTTPLRDCFGWPLPTPNKQDKSKAIAERIKADFAQLEARALSGDLEAVKEFEQLLTVFGDKHQHLLRERAKDGDKTLHGQHSIDALLSFADETIVCLGWLAKNKSADCSFWAKRRLNWPGFISVLASTNRKAKEVVTHIPLGQKYSHYNRKKTETDSLFQAARRVIDYVNRPGDSFSGIYFAPFVKGVEWMKTAERDEAIKKLAIERGPLTQENWDKWKPIFDRVVTLFYGPSLERWEMMPDSKVPQKILIAANKTRFKLRTYRDICPADIFGVLEEWGKHLSQNNKLTPAELVEIETWGKRKQSRPCIMDIEPDDALKRIKGRVLGRKGGWGDYKSEILNRCRRLLPKI
jgi:hypothetical protein